MKKTLKTVLACLFAAVVLASCSAKKEEFVFSNDTLTAVDGENSAGFSYNARTTITNDTLDTVRFGNIGSVSSSGEFSFNGVKVGDDAQTFADAFGIEYGKAMWETCFVIAQDEILFDYPAYSKSNRIGKMNFKKYDDLFLTVGYYTQNSADEEKEPVWKVFDSKTLKEAWNLELASHKANAISDICFVSAGFDESGKINVLDVYYGSYGEFSSSEQYQVNVDYFEEETTEVPAAEE